MTKTQNYSLNQWDAADAIRRADFNADNASLDTALTGLANRITAETNARAAAIAALNTAVSGHGNCRLEYGVYIGTGAIGSESPNSITFQAKPLLVIIAPQDMKSPAHVHGVMINGCVKFQPWGSNSSTYSTVIWSGNTVTWYCDESYYAQMNESGVTYAYVALSAADG